jgi:hypothetical protein
MYFFCVWNSQHHVDVQRRTRCRAVTIKRRSECGDCERVAGK